MAAGQTRAHQPTTKPQPAPHHHRAGEGVASMDVFADGPRAHLLTSRRHEGGATDLQYFRSNDGGASWAQPVNVGRGQPAPTSAQRGADVQVAAAGEHVVAVWAARIEPYTRGDGERLVTAISSDRGRTWRPGPQPATNAAGHAELPDLTADDRGAFHLVWLEAHDGKTALTYARSTDGGATWSRNLTLDAACCECCWNVVTCAPDGRVFVLYRDVAPRDMSLVHSDDGGQTWSAPVTVGRFGWDTSTCPHVGGGLAVLSSDSQRSVHAVVWTGHEGAAGAYALASSDGGATWGEPQPLGGAPGGAWHADVTHNGDLLAVVWDAYTEAGTAVFGATSRDAGRTWSAPRQLSAAGATATHPRVFPSANGFRAAWTEQAAKSSARLVIRTVE